MSNNNLSDWLWMNFEGIQENPESQDMVAPFPPKELMAVVSGTENYLDFASHGVHIYQALHNASPVPNLNFDKILDFGCGCGRVARLFKNSKSNVYCVDIDPRHIEWIEENLKFVKPSLTYTDKNLPFENSFFDCIFSISVFSHVTEAYHQTLLQELNRITSPSGYLMLSIHGERAIERVTTDENMFKLIGVPEDRLNHAIDDFKTGNYAFIPQEDIFLTTDQYSYGITFIPETYIREHWSKTFEIVNIYPGIIHDWQDIVVLRKLS